MSHPLYEIKDLKFRYGDRFELDIPDLIIESGSSVGLMGPNGGGKSTLLKILSFIEAPDEGTITFEGTPITGNETGSKRNITILLQDPYLLKRSVFDNVAYGLKIRNEKSNLRKKCMKPSKWLDYLPMSLLPDSGMNYQAEKLNGLLLLPDSF